MTTQIEVKERPIIMQPESIRAILEGRKTQTRRVVKPQPDYLWHDDPCSNDKGYINCPYGKPGDRLWVRETFSYITKAKNEWHDKIRPDGCPVEMLYRAEYPDADDMQFPMNWTPSIFMPRWASRITLEITSVRVERLQDISEADCIAEGIEDIGAGDLKGMYQVLWQGINEKKYPWSSNPFVWVVEFRRVTP